MELLKHEGKESFACPRRLQANFLWCGDYTKSVRPFTSSSTAFAIDEDT